MSSTYRRTRQATEILAPALDLTPLFDDDLQELRPGEILGLSIEEFSAKYQEEDFEENPFRAVAPGAENWGQFMLRVGSIAPQGRGSAAQYESECSVAVVVDERACLSPVPVLAGWRGLHSLGRTRGGRARHAPA